MHLPSFHWQSVQVQSQNTSPLSFFSPQLWTLKCLCVSRITYLSQAALHFTPRWLKSGRLSSLLFLCVQQHNIPSTLSSLVASWNKTWSSSASCYDRMQLLVLFMGGRKLVSFGKVSLRLRSAGLRRLGRFACCRSSLNTSTTLAFSFAEASR